MTGVIIDHMAVRVSSPVLIGRSGEIGRLRASLQAAHEGRSSATLLAGEAGVGKTRVVAEIAAVAQAEGAIVLLGGCIDLGEGSMPYAPVAEALRGLVRRADPEELERRPGPGSRRAGPAGPRPRARRPEPAASATGALSYGSGQGRLFELLLGVLERLADQGAGRVHRRGPALVRPLDPRPARVPRPEPARRPGRCSCSPTAPTSSTAATRCCRSWPSSSGPVASSGSRSCRSTGASRPSSSARSPATTSTRGSSSRSMPAAAATRSSARSCSSRPARTAGPSCPPTLRDVLLARTADLAEPTQEFLRVASAAGQRVDPALLAAAAALDETTLYEALRESVGRQVLVPDPTAGIERYAFRHALLQEAIYDDLLPGERTRLHSAFARTLEASSLGDAVACRRARLPLARGPRPAARVRGVGRGGRRRRGTLRLPRGAGAIRAGDRPVGPRSRRRGARRPGPDRAARRLRQRRPLPRPGARRVADPGGHPARRRERGSGPGRPAQRTPGPLRLDRGSGRARPAGVSHRHATDAAHPTERGARPGASPASPRSSCSMAGSPRRSRWPARRSPSRRSSEHATSRATRSTRAASSRSIGGEVDEGLDDLRAALAIAQELDIVDDVGRAYANIVWVIDAAGRLEEAIAAGRCRHRHGRAARPDALLRHAHARRAGRRALPAGTLGRERAGGPARRGGRSAGHQRDPRPRS